MSSWIGQAAPVFQIVGTLATAAAAVAAWRSASAAQVTAGKADETSRRATEALSRATMPELEILLSGGDNRSREPQKMNLYVRNDARHPCVVVAAKIERTDGKPDVTMVGPRVQLGTPVSAPTLDNVVYIPLSGPIPRLHPDAEEGAPRTDGTGPFLACSVDFTDAAGLVSWRQRVHFHEKVNFLVTTQENEIVVDPVYSYDWWHGRTEPELVPERPSSTPRSPGWLRRFLHWIW